MACESCGVNQKLASCEVHKKPGTRVCKTCCFTILKGPKCVWWDICWFRI